MNFGTMTFAPLGKDVNVDVDALPETSRAFAMAYGLRQLLADSHVSGKTPDEKQGLLDKKLDKLFEGTLHVRSGGTREGDPVARELTKLATAKVHKHITVKLGKKVKDVSADDMKTLMAKARALPALIEMAKANVAALAEDNTEL